MNAPLAFVDTETTGIHPEREPWEVAIIRRDPGGADKALHFWLPVNLRLADPFGLKIGGFYERHPQGKMLAGKTGTYVPEMVSLREAAEAVARWTHGAHIVGAVPNFDTEVLAKLLRSQGLIPAWHYHLIDVEALAVGYLSAKGEPLVTSLPWKSDDLSRACGVEPAGDDERHTALGDAKWAMRLYDAIVGGVA